MFVMLKFFTIVFALCVRQYSSTILINKIIRECELEALSVGTRLADHYSSFDEQTEWDVRIHHDYLVEHLGFAGWIQMGLWKNTQLTAEKNHAPTLHKVTLILYNC